MAMAASRISLEPPLDIPTPLVIPHPHPNPHSRLADVSTLARRVSSESQTHGRASPASRISRRTPVPFLLEAFPAPPSHIPGTSTSLTPGGRLNGTSLLVSTTGWSVSQSTVVPMNSVSPVNSNPVSPCSPRSVAATLHSNPPPSSPPTGPLPPIPGFSAVPPDVFAARRALQTVTRSASPALSTTESQRSQSRTEQRPPLSIEVNNLVRGRNRQGSLSSLRNPIYPVGEQREAIAEEPEESTRPPPTSAPQSSQIFGSVAERRSHDQSRGDSPDILPSSHSHVAVTPLPRSDDRLYVEDSIANVDMSDLTALKSDIEGDGDDQSSCPFPRCPPLPHLPSQSPIDPPSSSPLYVHKPRKPSKSSVHSIQVSHNPESMDARHGAMSPEIAHMISATPRPRKRSTPSQSREPSATRNRNESSRRIEAKPAPIGAHSVKTASVTKATRPNRSAGENDGHDSDSSLDLHTPLPELMLRHGMLSPNSRLLPQLEVDPARMSMMSSSSHLSNASNLSLMSTMSVSSKLPKDARDTPQRRVRHRDGKLLKGGIGLTTGLGWSDSEDEDAPSQLTRRVSTLVLSRRASSSSVASHPSSLSKSNSAQPLARSISHNILREAEEFESVDELGYSHRASLATRSLPSRTKPVSRVTSIRSNGSSIGRYSTHSNSSITSAGIRARAGSISESGVYDGSSRPDSLGADARTSAGLMPGIREQDDGVTPTRAAFERSSLGSLNGGSGADVPHTPSSTTSSASLPFPVTPEGGAEIPQLQPVYNKDKVLPPLPPSVRGRPSNLTFQSRSGGLQRPRTYSNVSSVSNNSMLDVPSGEPKSKIDSPTSTPRQSLAERPRKAAIPAASPRPSLKGTPRPSLTIPKLPPHATSALPRSTTPSSPYPNYTPRPLRLVSRSSPFPSSTQPNLSSPPLPNHAELNQSSGKALQPGEQFPRPGQVLTYNRNVHDQLKLRPISLNNGPHRSQAPGISPGGTQTMFGPSPVVGSAPNSAVSTPTTALSQSALPSPSPGVEGVRPRPRTGTGMMYRNNLSMGTVAASRIRGPSTVAR